MHVPGIDNMTTDTQIVEETESSIEVAEPKLYKVILHNDNKTTFDFVIMVLVKIFHRTFEEAVDLTKNIHIDGQGVAGSPYTREIAEEKTTETVNYARANGFPLVATYEEL